MMLDDTLSKKYLFLKPALGSKNYHEFIACIGLVSESEF